MKRSDYDGGAGEAGGLGKKSSARGIIPRRSVRWGPARVSRRRRSSPWLAGTVRRSKMFSVFVCVIIRNNRAPRI